MDWRAFIFPFGVGPFTLFESTPLGRWNACHFMLYFAFVPKYNWLLLVVGVILAVVLEGCITVGLRGVLRCRP